MTSTAIPNRQVFRAQEVCEIAQVQPYVLRSWEAEFPDLGLAKTARGQRVYRRGDVERVLRLKHLLFAEGLTLAGARKRLAEEGALSSGEAEAVSDQDVAALLDEEMRQGLVDVRRGLRWVLGVLDGGGVTPEDFVLVADPPASSKHRAGAGSKGKAARGAGAAGARAGRAGPRKRPKSRKQR